MSTATAVHINTGGGTWPLRFLMRCPVCGVEQARVVSYESGSPWYPPRLTCAECGDSWSDGMLAERPFRRGWRKAAQAQALADWNAAPQLGTRVARDWSEDGGGYITGYLFPWEVDEPALPLHRTEAGWPNCATCDGGGCPDCTDPA